MSNRTLSASRRQLFEGRISEDCGFRSIPLLLQEVASYMQYWEVEDPEFDNLLIERVFPETDSDTCRYTAILSYRKEGDK